MKKAIIGFGIFIVIMFVATAIYNYARVDYSAAVPKLLGTWETEDKSISFTIEADNNSQTGSRTIDNHIEFFKWKLSRGRIVFSFVDENGKVVYKEKYSIGVAGDLMGLRNEAFDLQLHKTT